MNKAKDQEKFAESLIAYFLTRNTPWDDEETMKEAVRLTVYFMLGEAAYKTRELL